MCEVCKRTYLSYRDLQAHIQHRHIRKATVDHSNINASQNQNVHVSQNKISPYNNGSNSSFQSPIPVLSTRSNLITVPIHDDSSNIVVSPTMIQQHGSKHYSQNTSYMSPHNVSQRHGHTQWPGMSNSNQYQAGQMQNFGNQNRFDFQSGNSHTSWPIRMNHGNPYNRPFYQQ